MRGPRQIGKTTLSNQMIQCLLEGEVEARRIFRLQFDELPALKQLDMPLIELTLWYEQNILGCTLTQAANEGKPATH